MAQICKPLAYEIFIYSKKLILPRHMFSRDKRYLSTNDSSSSTNDTPSSEHLHVLKTNFGLDNFKSNQWPIIKSIIHEQKDNYVSLPMGYGKSLCYQYPAVYKNGLSVVITPLISLMQDQIRILKENNIPSCFLASIQVKKKYIIKKLHEGHYRLLYIAPESALTAKGIELLKSLNETCNITLFAIDEAHCVLHWGRDFRPLYQKLFKLRLNCPSVPIIALTATATTAEKYGIIESLGMRNPLITLDGYNRSNLYFKVKQMGNEPYGDIMDVLKNDVKQHNVEDGSIIIYCLTIRTCRKISQILNLMGLSCSIYHSELGRFKRENILNNFMNGNIKVIVATSAFGMGLNKKDVRIIIHYGTPLSIESYYQEVGRAGRDEKQALCVLYYSTKDFTTHRYLSIRSSKKDQDIFNNDGKFSIISRYVTNLSCRRDYILTHFGLPRSSPPVKNKFKCCDNCDNNENKIVVNLLDCSSDTEILLKAIESFSPRTFGIHTIISLLLGNKKKKILNICQGNKYYGAGSVKSKAWWRNLALYLEIENYIKITTIYSNNIMYTKATIDDKGRDWLKNKINGNVSPVLFNLDQQCIGQ